MPGEPLMKGLVFALPDYDISYISSKAIDEFPVALGYVGIGDMAVPLTYARVNDVTRAEA